MGCTVCGIRKHSYFWCIQWKNARWNIVRPPLGHISWPREENFLTAWKLELGSETWNLGWSSGMNRIFYMAWLAHSDTKIAQEEEKRKGDWHFMRAYYGQALYITIWFIFPKECCAFVSFDFFYPKGEWHDSVAHIMLFLTYLYPFGH